MQTSEKMSGPVSGIQDKLFSVEVAKQGRAVCKKCKRKCLQGELRIAKLVSSPQRSADHMKSWYHVNCIFEMFAKQRQTTRRIERPHDIDGWELLNKSAQVDIVEKIDECNKGFEVKLQKTARKPKAAANKTKPHATLSDDSLSVSSDSMRDGVLKENCFRMFRAVVADVSNEGSATKKTGVFSEIFSKGCDGTGFKGDILLWCKLLLPTTLKRVFPLQTKHLVKIFSRIFQVSEDKIMEKLDPADVGLTIQNAFGERQKRKLREKSCLTIHEVDEFLETLTCLSDEEELFRHFQAFVKKCTSNDLKVVIRLIKHDLRMNAGPKQVFGGLHQDAYLVFQSCRDIKSVINACWEGPVDKQTQSPNPKRKRKASSSPKKAKSETSTKLPPPRDAEIVEPVAEIAFSETCKSTSNYFENVRLYVEEGLIGHHVEWLKYFIDYGGMILKTEQNEEATHILHLKDTISEPTINCAKTARHVIVEWIKDTVATKTLQDVRPYTVRWKPSHVPKASNVNLAPSGT